MTWVRLDDQISENPKLDAVGPVGSWMHICAIAYCNRHLTDGVFPQRMVSRLGSFDLEQVMELPAQLLSNGLWHGPGHNCGSCPGVSPGLYLVHGYAEFQPSRADVEERRQNLSDWGKRGAVKKAQLRAERQAQALAEAGAQVAAGQSSPDPARPVETSKEVSSSAVVTQLHTVAELHEAVLVVCNIDPDQVPRSASGAYDRSVADLRKVGATPDEVMNRAMAFRRLWPDASLTPTALSRHWAELNPADHNTVVLADFGRGGDK